MPPVAGLSTLQPTAAIQSGAGASVLNNPAATISTPAPPASPGNGAYWVGSDGNVYLKAAGGNGAAVTNLGSANNIGAADMDAKIGKAVKISDPNPSAPPTDNTGTASTYEDKSADIAANQAGLAALSPASSLATLSAANNTIQGEYAGDLATAATADTTSSADNENDLQSNKETALEDAVSGRQGLYGTLASLGALNGSGLTLANNAVAKGANEDLDTASDTYATNQSAIDSAYTKYKQDETNAATTAQDAYQNDEEQVNNDNDKTEQNYLSGIANDYQLEGNTAQASNYDKQASALDAEINATNVPTIDEGYTGTAYTAPSLASYVGQANNTVVQPTAGSGNSGLTIPGLVAVNKKTAS